MVDGKVIVIEPSDSQARALESLLRFLDLEPVRVRNLAQLQRAPLEEGLALLVGAPALEEWGETLTAHLRERQQLLPVIFMSSDGLPKLAESSADLVWLPLELPVKQRRLCTVLNQAQNLRSGHPTQPGAHRFRPSGQSRVMRDVHRLIEQVAPFDTGVLILGESGTGKEMVARHIHELSNRASQPFVPVNCGAIPADLLESELFGHEKGAFTGALTTRLGRFEYAEGGTLFLDEIGDMSMQMQVKLLRVLQERSFERVGSNRTIRCNVRIIAATHRDLEAAIGANRFREDLYYRLNVFPVQVPPLRERLEDLPVLIEHLLQRQTAGSARRLRFDAAAMRCLAQHRWPGNVRELANLLERLVILHPDQTIGAEHLPDRYRPAGAAPPFADTPWFGEEVLIGQAAPTDPAYRATTDPAHRAPADPVSVASDLSFAVPLAASAATAQEEHPPLDPSSMTAAAARATTSNGCATPVAYVEETIEGLQASELLEGGAPELPSGGIDLKDHLSSIEIRLIRKALAEADGTVAGAARLLNIRRTTLVEKLRKYRLSA